MNDDASNGTKNSPIDWLGGATRVAFASLAIITTHYLGFFSTLSNDYYFTMSPTLVKRVAWELTSRLAFTSLYIAVFYLATGLLKGMVLGVVRANKQEESFPADDVYAIDPIVIAGLYLLALAATYFPFEVTLYERTLISITFLMFIVLIYFVFLKEHGDGTQWSRFVSALRHRELALRALIAFALSVAYLAGKSLAWSLMSAEPTSIITVSGEVRAVILDVTDTDLLLKNDIGLVLLPMHQVKKVTWLTNLSEDASIPQKN